MISNNLTLLIGLPIAIMFILGFGATIFALRTIYHRPGLYILEGLLIFYPPLMFPIYTHIEYSFYKKTENFKNLRYYKSKVIAGWAIAILPFIATPFFHYVLGIDETIAFSAAEYTTILFIGVFLVCGSIGKEK